MEYLVNIKSIVISTQHSADVNQSQVKEIVKPYIEKCNSKITIKWIG